MNRKKVIFSAIQPSGAITLGNYLGALKNWIALQDNYEALYALADLHAITVWQEPATFRKNIYDAYALLLAMGIDHKKSIFFVQSHVPEHAQLAWMLKAEVIKSLRGESAFSQDLLGSLISDCETKSLEVQQQLEAAQLAYDEGQAVLEHLNAQYDDIISWADMYDTASMEAKKMIVNCLIKRVEVYRDYKLHIDFNIDFEQFSMGMDIVAIAA